GGGRIWTARGWLLQFFEFEFAPRRRWNLSTPERALLWMEWRRSGFVLPLAVGFVVLLILWQADMLIGNSAAATIRTVTWLSLAPILFAIPVGLGLGKPDFWSL